MVRPGLVPSRTTIARAVVVALSWSVLWPVTAQAARPPPMRPAVEGVTVHEDCVGGGGGSPVNMCEYSVWNDTDARMCYRLLAHITGSYDLLPSFHDTEWQECRPVGETVPLGKQKIFVHMRCRGSYPGNYCEPLSVEDIYVRVMPFPAAGSCQAYRGVVDIDPATREWFCDVEKAAALSQQPTSQIERMCLSQGVKLLRPPAQELAVPATAVAVAPGTTTPVPPAPPIDVTALASGWGRLEWGITLADFKASFPKASVENTWWSTGEGLEKFAGKWMTARYAFNEHERLAMVQFLPEQSQRAAVAEAVEKALGQPTSESPPHRSWVLPDGDVQVSLMFSGQAVLVRHKPLADD